MKKRDLLFTIAFAIPGAAYACDGDGSLRCDKYLNYLWVPYGQKVASHVR